jgi:amidophosphoribosyltransferase
MSGLFGVVSKKENCIQTLFYGTDYHSHLGTQFGGMAVWGKDLHRKIRDISQSQFKSKFYEDYSKMVGEKGIGVISDKDEQPIYLNAKFGPFVIVTNGLLQNEDKLIDELHNLGSSFSELTDGSINSTEIIAKLISKSDSVLDGIKYAFTKLKGSCSLLILTKKGIYAARDKEGRSSLIVGKNKDSWAITTETCAFNNMGFEVRKYLQPSEIVFISKKGIKQLSKPEEKSQMCAFEWIYTSFPASTHEGINVELVREKCGRLLAKKDDVDVDVVSGVPDSGTAHALGYAIQSKKPFRRPLVKYTQGYGRSYTPPSQKTRDLIARMKLVPIKEVINGNRIILCDDSIVRGTQLKNYTINKLWENGAKEIHLRIACPPLMFPCHFNSSTRTLKELAARRAIKALEGHVTVKDIHKYLDPESRKYKRMVNWIAKDINVTTLKYISIDDMIKAIGLPKDKVCTKCWRGE